MNSKIKLTTNISPETSLSIEELSKTNDTTKGRIIEQAINYYMGNNKNENIELDTIKKQLNKVQEQNEHLLNLLNSLCVALNYSSDFAAADLSPCNWLKESKNKRSQELLKRKHDKLIRDSEYH